MPESEKLMPAEPRHLADAIAFALRFPDLHART